jgi:hypothetical protein
LGREGRFAWWVCRWEMGDGRAPPLWRCGANPRPCQRWSPCRGRTYRMRDRAHVHTEGVEGGFAVQRPLAASCFATVTRSGGPGGGGGRVPKKTGQKANVPEHPGHPENFFACGAAFFCCVIEREEKRKKTCTFSVCGGTIPKRRTGGAWWGERVSPPSLFFRL